MNRPLMLALRNDIADHPEKFKMSSWFFHQVQGRREPLWPKDAMQQLLGGALDCGTSGCAAGRTILLADQALLKPLAQKYLKYFADETAPIIGIDDIAAELLGLPHNDLFWRDRWPRGKRMSDSKRIVEILDDLLAGNDPWANEPKPKGKDGR